MKREQITAVLLAGGKSQRMGQNKALLPYRDSTLLQTQLEKLKEVFGHIIVNGTESELPQLPVPVYPDLKPGLGPVGGLYSLMQFPTAPTLFLLSCDTPLVSPDLIRYLLAQLSPSDNALVPVIQGQVQPLCGFYSTRILPTLTAFVRSGQRKMQDLLKEIDARSLEIDPNLDFYHKDLFFNVNTPEDYQTLIDAHG